MYPLPISGMKSISASFFVGNVMETKPLRIWEELLQKIDTGLCRLIGGVAHLNVTCARKPKHRIKPRTESLRPESIDGDVPVLYSG